MLNVALTRRLSRLPLLQLKVLVGLLLHPTTIRSDYDHINLT